MGRMPRQIGQHAFKITQKLVKPRLTTPHMNVRFQAMAQYQEVALSVRISDGHGWRILPELTAGGFWRLPPDSAPVSCAGPSKLECHCCPAGGKRTGDATGLLDALTRPITDEGSP